MSKKKEITTEQALVALKYMGACGYGLSAAKDHITTTPRKAWEDDGLFGFKVWIARKAFRKGYYEFDYASSFAKHWPVVERHLLERYQAAMRAKKKAGKKWTGRTAGFDKQEGPF